eukprot:Amastigsp_a686159_5.p4 type:complete len:171 gc:universal Amastigsp_a686159_5:895-1407(+)
MDAEHKLRLRKQRCNLVELLKRVEGHAAHVDLLRVKNRRVALDRVGVNNPIGRHREPDHFPQLVVRRAVKAGAEERKRPQKNIIIVAFDGVVWDDPWEALTPARVRVLQRTNVAQVEAIVAVLRCGHNRVDEILAVAKLLHRRRQAGIVERVDGRRRDIGGRRRGQAAHG